MKSKNTHISFLLDRTGSMLDVLEETISGFNVFLRAQKADDIPTSFLLAQFDSVDPFDVLEDFSSINDVGELNTNVYVPRGMTPLYDAICQLIKYTEEKITTLQQKNAPDLIICAILTDGLENCSSKYDLKTTQELINEKTAQGWKFSFLGADMDAVKEGNSLGIDSGTSMTFNKSLSGVLNAYNSTSDLMNEWKVGNVSATYSTTDRNKAME